MQKAAAAYREQKGAGMQSKHDDQSGKGSGKDDMHGGHYARADGSVTEKEKSKYSGHRHRPARNPVKGDSSDEDSAPASPGRRITRGMIGAIARSCMLEKATLRKCMEFAEGPYDFLLVENIPVEHRSRARLNGWRNVKGLL